MMPRPITLLTSLAIAVLLFMRPAQAQLAISADDFRAQTGATFEQFLAGTGAGALPQNLSALESILLADGNNGTFDFSAITPQLDLFSTNYYLQLPSDSVNVPGFEDFFEGKATDAWQVNFVNEGVPDAFIFRKITEDSLAWLGNGVWLDSNGDGVADPVVSVFTPGKLQAPLPLQINNSWTSDFTHVNVVNTPVGVIEVPGVVESHDIKVDGYGTLITHEGSYPCLRVQINQTIQRPDGSSEEMGGWSFITSDLVQLGVFYAELIPDNPADITFDFQQPHSISLFGPATGDMPTAIESDATLLPETFSIGQNYPNPFNPGTSIPFELFEAGHVRLSIYNVIGQLLDVPFNGRLQAGSHRVQWRATDQPSGIYFYRLELDGVVRQRTMMLLK